ncbi:MAG: FAD:protein FMN transferase [Candidatus Thiodiazotropha sp. (ex Lucinoma aequizonata)]|nr:FAD:protein FMN transferase [Candidatus Thiodiazotropha sp. (ex Lucinoma aequizonata)]MCU7889552.1 FAD:protein FMN transferase [Candidatus Thiodiazotropha sp. (ex Lucinoma aequizonata)]MCU7898527.1 FAD:protein FMN transferase [Candidatus Thiodiazotropha sp. (ex Lucinoma aequizonata)]MCU7909248.1 FAD:protein FMN transferase [Candidatus Thiodiazotropha sp. (ex Lucinoma aequizonata)]MCU7912649.1 FAD:protein FMN transferase [Candidatus Thiodiazotropha sp. (ex Lucinoma aequizonata)]
MSSSGCDRNPNDYQQTLLVFGTLLDIKAYTDNPTEFDNAVRSLDLTFQEMHREWHAWKGEGELVRLNRAIADGRPLEVSPDLAGLLRQAKHYSDKSDQLFNPAIGQLIGLWGFHSDEPPGGPPPDPTMIRSLLEDAPSMGDMHFDGDQISSVNSAVSIDLGAFAKGHALNLAIDQLKRFGIDHAIVNAGGDLCASGQHGDRPWKIGIRHPLGEGVIASVAISDSECVLTSGNYERYREYEGIRYAHILDPRTGFPVEHVASTTVISSNGGLADAAATALSVAGPQAWRVIAEQMDLTQVMLVDEKGVVYLTPEMRDRIELQQMVSDIRVSEPGK